MSVSPDAGRHVYWQRLKQLADHYDSLSSTSGHRITLQGDIPLSVEQHCRIWLDGELFTREFANLRAINATDKSHSACIVQNITPIVMAEVGTQLDVDPQFFISFMCDGRDAISARQHEDEVDKGIKQSTPFWTVRGQFVCNSYATANNWITRERSTHLSWNATGTDCISTCISHIRLQKIDLYLIDEMPILRAKGRRAEVTFQTFDTPGHRALQLLLGLGPLEDFPSLYWSCDRYARSETLREIREALTSHPRQLDWILCTWGMHHWQRCYTSLDLHVQRISYLEIREPNDVANERLHNAREDLARLKRAVHWGSKISRDQEPTDAQRKDYFAASNSLQPHARAVFKTAVGNAQSPYSGYKELLQDIQRQEDIVVQSFQLLLSTIGVQESQASSEEARRSIEQGRRGALITWLAFIYVPLSFITGIFGMNVKEINGASPPFWVVLIAIPVVLVVTLALYGAYKLWEGRKGGNWHAWKALKLPSRSKSAMPKEASKLV